MNDQETKQAKTTVDEIPYSLWRKLVDIIDRSVDDDWEKIALLFPKYFKQEEIDHIRNKPINVSKANSVLDILRFNLVPVSRLYKCFKELEMIQAYHYVEAEYPVFKKMFSSINQQQQVLQLQQQQQQQQQQQNQQQQQQQMQALFNLNISNDSNMYREAYKQNENENFVLKNISNQNQLPNSNSDIQMLTQFSSQLQFLTRIISNFEAVLPVIKENKPLVNDPIMKTSSLFFNNEPSCLPSINVKLQGRFEIYHIIERKLTFKKREFLDPFDYIHELQMIKHRHLNLYTAECIFKNMLSSSYFLLYSYRSSYTTKLLSEFAYEKIKLDPSQFNVFQQVIILRDISCALEYLHEKSEFKQDSILFGNLNPDCILIEFKNEDHIIAKLVDFTNIIKVDDTKSFDSNKRDEYFRFGLIVFGMITWRFMEKDECEKIHNKKLCIVEKNKLDLQEYQYEIYKYYGLIDYPNQIITQNLFRIFFGLTSPDYQIQKGLKRAYEIIKDLATSRSVWNQKNT